MKAEELLEAIGCIDTNVLQEAEKVSDYKLPKKDNAKKQSNKIIQEEKK